MRSAGVIGWPVAHSKSPLIHRFWLAKLGLDGDYGRFAVQPGRLGEAIRALPALGMRGVNVTVPHKVAVLAHLDHLHPLAAQVGAVNTVVVEVDGGLTGHNTDVAGFLEPLLREKDGRAPRGRHYDVIGTGGVARAVAVALSAEDVTFYGRDLSKAADLAAGCAAMGRARPIDALARASAPAEARGDASGTYVVVNASSLGMSGNAPVKINLDTYPDDTIVYDLVYAPLETPLLAAARARGLRTIDGLAMLIGQAAAAFELFFGAAAPRGHDAELRALLIG